MVSWFVKAWSQPPKMLLLFKPIQWLYRFISTSYYLAKRYPAKTADRPFVLLVSNLIVGGAGKTPLVAAITNWLKQNFGLNCAIVLRGYKGNFHGVHGVKLTDLPEWVGDEALMYKKNIDCVVVVAKDRGQAIAYINKHYPQIQCVLLDDGLQNSRTVFDRALLVEKKTVNNELYPIGPYRSLFHDVAHLIDLKLGYLESSIYQSEHIPYFQLIRSITHAYDARTGQPYSLAQLREKVWHAVIAIADPTQFLEMLSCAGIRYQPHVYPDHHTFTQNDLQSIHRDVLLTTAKDAVKLMKYPNRIIVVALEVKLPIQMTELLSTWLHDSGVIEHHSLH